MDMTFKQCSAIKPDGHQCQRTAKKGDYCHSHRCCKPKIDYSHLDPEKDLNLEGYTGLAVGFCSDCGHTFTFRGACPAACDNCLSLRALIENRISEALAAVPGGLSREKLFKDLEQFGIEAPITEAARLRMHADGRLVDVDVDREEKLDRTEGAPA
jgi:hypothetical protein